MSRPDRSYHRRVTTADQLTEREAALFSRTRRETLLEIRDEFALYATRRPSWRDRAGRNHARWAVGILDRVLERLDRISGPADG
jgi:hypothetical protein